MGRTTINGIKGFLHALAKKFACWIASSKSRSYVQKDKDTIRKFQIIKKLHVQSLKEQLKERET